MAEPEVPEDVARRERRRRYGRLPDRIHTDEIVESVPTAPRPDDEYDPDVDTVRRFGL